MGLDLERERGEVERAERSRTNTRSLCHWVSGPHFGEALEQ